MVDTVRSTAQLLAFLHPNIPNAAPDATVLQAQTARDLIVSIGTLAGIGVVVDGVRYPFTTAGVQAAHDSLPVTGGALIIPPNSPIQGSYTTLNLYRDNLYVLWPKSSPLLAPTGGDQYTLVKVGSTPVYGVNTLLTVDAAHGNWNLNVASTAAFQKDSYIELLNNTGQKQVNRVREVTSGSVLRLYRPISAPLTVASGCVARPYTSPPTNITIDGLYIKNNDNTNPGLITNWVASAQTTITTNAAAGATSITLTSATGFATGSYILLRDGTKTYGEALGYVSIITNLAGAVATLAGPIPFTLLAASTTVQNVSLGTVPNNYLQIAGNVGIYIQQTARIRMLNISGDYITGPLIVTNGNYEPEFRNVIPYQCGYAWLGTIPNGAASFASAYDMGGYFDNVYAENALSWGVEILVGSQHRGNAGAVSCTSRGTKLASVWDSVMHLWSLTSKATGVTVSEASCHNMLTVHAESNILQGLWVSDQTNNDNYIVFHGTDNGSGLPTPVEVSSGATDLRNTIVVQNADANLEINKAVNWVKPQQVPYNGTNYSASAGAWTVDLADQESFSIKMDGNVMEINLRIVNSSVSGGPNALYFYMPNSAISSDSVGPIACSIIDAGVPATGFAYVAPGSPYVQVFREDLAAWANSVGQTNVGLQIRVQVNV